MPEPGSRRVDINSLTISRRRFLQIPHPHATSDTASDKHFARLKRRTLVKIGLGITAALGTGTTAALIKGIRISEPDITPHQVVIKEPTYKPIQSEEVAAKIERNSASETTKLLIDRPEPMFTPDSTYKNAHRAGNTIEDIRKAFDMGAQIFDIDLNDVDGTLYGEHGLVKQLIKVGKIKLRFLWDWNEKEAKLGSPDYTFERLVEQIAQLSTPQKPLAAAIELKRGKFKEKTLQTMFKTLNDRNVPAIIFSRNPDRIQAAEKQAEAIVSQQDERQSRLPLLFINKKRSEVLPNAA